ncbi:hypothetical protein ABK040_003983 [Willaertia magna]
MSLLSSSFIFSFDKEQFTENLNLLSQFFYETILLNLKIKSKDNQFNLLIKNNNLDKNIESYFIFHIPSFSYLKSNHLSITINILNINEKKHQLLLQMKQNQIEQQNHLEKTLKIYNILLGRFKANKHNSLFLYNSQNNFTKNMLSIKKQMNLQMPVNSYPISLNTFIIPINNENSLINMLRERYKRFIRSKVKISKKERVKYFDFCYYTNYLISSFNVKMFYRMYGNNVAIVRRGKFFVNKEILIGGKLKFEFEYAIELENIARTFVFGSVRGGDGLFSLKEINQWSEVKYVDICKEQINF